MAMKSKGWGLIFLVLIAVLAGCTAKKQVVQEGPRYGPLYCYASLAEPDCYAVPLEEGSRHLVGFYEGPSGTQETEIEIACFRLLFVKEICPER